MGTVVVDSSAIIALADAADALHERARELAERWNGPQIRALLPATALAEIMVEPIRRGWADRMEGLLAESELEVVPIDAEVALAAARARAQRRGLRLPDALIIATALVNDAELVTLDRRMMALMDHLRG